MKFRYIGTAAAEGIPSIYCDCPVCRNARQNGGKDIRARSGAVIDETLLIDYPPDIYMQCLNGLLDARLIRSVLITHAHADHCDMYELMFRSDPYFCLPSCEYTLHIYGNAAARYRFDEACRETPINHAEFHIINPYSPFLVQGFTVTALPANHAYEQAAFIFLLEKDGKRILYANDTGYFLPETMEYLKEKHCDFISFDCTMSLAVPDAGYGHMGIDCVARLRDDLIAQGTAGPDTLCVCNHFSHNGLNMGGGQLRTHSDLLAQAQKRGLDVSFDGMEIVL